jgi:hypothetical protein
MKSPSDVNKEKHMSEMTLFSNNLPDYLQEVELDDLTKNLAGNTATKRISIRGGVFRMMVNGEELAKNTNRTMNIVIVNGAPNISRSLYLTQYDPKKQAAPDCWSNDGVKPDASIEAPQNSTCEGCPQNIQGSGKGVSRACKFQQRLAVVLADDIKGDVYQLTIPSKSLFGRGESLDKMPFQQYAKYVGSQGKNINTLVTEMRMDDDSDTPKLVFKAVRFLNRDEWEIAKEKGNTPAAKAAVVQTPAQLDGIKTKRALPPKVEATEETEEVVPEPVKRTSKKAAAEPTPKKDFVDVLSEWSTDDE